MPKFRMPTFGNGRNNSKTACVCLCRVWFPKLRHPVFQRCKHKTLTSPTTCRDSASCGIAQRRRWHCFPGPFNVMKQRRRGGNQRMSLQKRANSVTARTDLPSAGAQCDAERAGSPASSQSIYVVSGEIYVRLKPYLVVKISFDIVTEHCCQVRILSMMFCRSDCRLWSCGGQWLRNQETPRSITSLTSPWQANVGYEKCCLHVIFTFYLDRDTSVLELFPVVVFQ